LYENLVQGDRNKRGNERGYHIERPNIIEG